MNEPFFQLLNAIRLNDNRQDKKSDKDKMLGVIAELRKSGIALVDLDRLAMLNKVLSAAAVVLSKTGQIQSGVFYSADEDEISGRSIVAEFVGKGLMLDLGGSGYVPTPAFLKLLREVSGE